MLVSAARSHTASAPFLTGFERAEAAAMAARCGNDVVRLKPAWPAVIAATRFAGRSRWLFGHRAAMLACLEPQPKRWLTQRAADDPVQVQFDLARWGSAYARSDGAGREITIFAADGTVVAALRLDEIEPELDELLWLLCDDDQSHDARATARRTAVSRGLRGDEERVRDAFTVLEHRSDFDRLVASHGITRQHAFHLAGPDVARPLAAGALHDALVAALEAHVPLQCVLENGGGRVVWSPRAPLAVQCDGALDVCGALVRLSISDTTAGVWAVRLAGTASADQTLEAYGGSDARWLTVALAGATPRERDCWRAICAMLGGRSTPLGGAAFRSPP